MKHAYCIIAFNHWSLLEKLIILLDDERNDIYIHIDKNADFHNPAHYAGLAVKSSVYFLERIPGAWGTPGLAYIQLAFYKEACKRRYAYYHLLSGVCLPLKTQDEIHAFFNKHAGKEFVHYVCRPPVPKAIYERYSLYHFFIRHVRGSSLFKRALFGVLAEKTSVFLQRLLKIDRQKDIQNILCYGSNWSSITHELAAYTVSRLDEIYKRTRYTFAPDESILQTVLYDSPFIDHLYHNGFDDDYISCQRCIDWKRGNPYVWTQHDFEELMNSGFLFARKFDPDTDQTIIDSIYTTIDQRQHPRHASYEKEPQ